MKTDYYKTKESVEEYVSMAKDVNGAELIKKLKDYLPLQSDMLELGSGPGTDWNILAQSYNVIGSDNSKEFIKYLNENYAHGDFLELDAITITTDNKFDGIYSNKVLHHLTDSELIESVKRQHDLLNHNAIICHSFWKGTGNEIFNGLYVNYQTKDSLAEFFGDLFEILLIDEYAEFEDGDSLLFIGKRKR